VVRCKDGRKMVKQLLARRGGDIVLGSINQAHQQTTVSLEDIDSIHRVGGVLPRGSEIESRGTEEESW
jgi:phage repressor protein C with HTH and peptisase S24 domain